MKKSKYMTRALKAKDGRFAVILGKLGYTATDEGAERKRPEPRRKKEPVKEEPVLDPVDTLAELREQYFNVIGKRPFHGWDEEDLKRRIDEYEED